MKYLIFRTDRIGDFLITSPLIDAIKKNNSNAQVYVVSSNKNNEFINKYNFVNKVFQLKKNNFINKVKLYFELNKYSFDGIIVSDKKNKSIFLTLLLKSKIKIFNVSKEFQKKILNLFFKNLYLDNDFQVNTPISKILSYNCKALNLTLKNENFHYLKLNQFSNEFIYDEILDTKNQNNIIIHYDEKWEINNYTKVYKKASSLTDLNVDTRSFLNFLSELSNKKTNKIIITTGTLNTKIIENLKNILKKINNHIYEIKLNGKTAYLLVNQNFFSISHLISKSSLFISCHGAFTHIASNYKIKILDIIEKGKYNHYSRITNHMDEYKILYRDNFNKLGKAIIEQS